MSADLKPCPFCGGEATKESCDRLITIGCANCGYSRAFHGCIQVAPSNVKVSNIEYYHEDAILHAAEAWNRRAAPDAPAVQAEPVAWAVCNGVRLHGLVLKQDSANEYAKKAQMDHDLSGSLAAFKVRPLVYGDTHPPADMAGKLAQAEYELETERMRLAAVSTAALGYFDDCHDEYRSAALQDVLNLRKRFEHSTAVADKLAEALKTAVRVFGKYIYPCEETNAALTEISAALAEFEQKGGV